MLEWLEGPGANWREAPREGAPIGGQPTLFLRLGATKAKLSALALAAVATYAVFRGGGKR